MKYQFLTFTKLKHVVSQAALISAVAFLFDNGNAQDNPSRTVQKQTNIQVVLDEQFNNNNKRWPVFSNDAEARAEIKDGHFLIGSRVNEWYFSTIPVTVNQNSNFQIQCTVEKTSGVDNYFYGLIWGFKDSRNFYNLAITGDGRVAVTKKENDKFFNFNDTATSNPHVNRYNSVNKFRITKDGNQLEFFINDHLVHKMPFQPFLGSNIGFILYNKIQLAFDDLIVTAKSVTPAATTPAISEKKPAASTNPSGYGQSWQSPYQMAIFAFAQEQYDPAIESFKNALSAAAQELGVEHEVYQAIFDAAMTACFKGKRYAQAEQLCLSTLQKMSSSHQQYQKIKGWLTFVYLQSGQFNKVIPEYEKLLMAMDTTNSGYEETERQFIQMCLHEKQYDKIARLYKLRLSKLAPGNDAYQRYQKALGQLYWVTGNFDAIESLNINFSREEIFRLAFDNYAVGNGERTKKLLLQAIDQTQQELGRRHQSTLALLLNLSAAHLGMGELQEAREYYTQYHDMLGSVPGHEHIETVLRTIGQVEMTTYAKPPSQGIKFANAKWQRPLHNQTNLPLQAVIEKGQPDNDQILQMFTAQIRNIQQQFEKFQKNEDRHNRDINRKPIEFDEFYGFLAENASALQSKAEIAFQTHLKLKDFNTYHLVAKQRLLRQSDNLEIKQLLKDLQSVNNDIARLALLGYSNEYDGFIQTEFMGIRDILGGVFETSSEYHTYNPYLGQISESTTTLDSNDIALNTFDQLYQRREQRYMFQETYGTLTTEQRQERIALDNWRVAMRASSDRIEWIRRLQQDFRKISALYQKWKDFPISVKDVAYQLPRGCLYLDFVDYYNSKRKGYLVFYIHRNSERTYRIGIRVITSTDEINALIDSLRSELGATINFDRSGGSTQRNVRPVSSSPRSFEKTAASLYTKLFQPFSELLDATQVLVISLDGKLSLLPFELLKVPGKPGYLLDHKKIFYANGRDLIESKIWNKIQPGYAPPKLSKGIVFAYPQFYSGVDFNQLKNASLKHYDSAKQWPISFTPLPYTLEEGLTIRFIFGEEAIVYADVLATEDNLKKFQSPRFLHIATHGFFLDNPILRNGVSGGVPVNGYDLRTTALHLNGLAMAGCNRWVAQQSPPYFEDGFLTALEITGLQLEGTDLVVLSACETGVGKLENVNGISGLRRAFKTAGAQNIIMSLWSVPDKETAILMRAFYERYARGDSPLKALDGARQIVRQHVIKEYNEDRPLLWGAFVLDGSYVPPDIFEK